MELQYHEARSKRKNRQDMRSECAVVNISEHSQVPSFPEPVASFGHALMVGHPFQNYDIVYVGFFAAYNRL